MPDKSDEFGRPVLDLTVFEAFDESQPRDESGKWTTGGGAGPKFNERQMEALDKERWRVKNLLQEARGSERFYDEKLSYTNSELAGKLRRLNYIRDVGWSELDPETVGMDTEKATKYYEGEVARLKHEGERLTVEYEQAKKDIETHTTALDRIQLVIKGGTPLTSEELEAPIIPEGTAEPRTPEEFKAHTEKLYKEEMVAYAEKPHKSEALNACQNYVGNTYGNMRRVCMDGGHTIGEQERNYAITQIKGLDQYIKDNPNKEPVSLYRGMSLNIDEFTPGATFVSPAFGSFSTDEGVAADFVSGQGQKDRVMLHVVAPKGAQVTPTVASYGRHNNPPVTFNTQEREYVAARGYRLRVLTKTWNDKENRWMVRCKWEGVTEQPDPKPRPKYEPKEDPFS